MSLPDSDIEVKEETETTPIIFDFDISPPESSEDSTSPVSNLIDIFDYSNITENSVQSSVPYPPLSQDLLDVLDQNGYSEPLLSNSVQFPTPSPWFTGSIMSTYQSDGNGYSSSVSSGGQRYRGNGFTNIRDPSVISGGSSSDDTPPLLLSPGIHQHQGTIGETHYNGYGENVIGKSPSVNRSNSLPFELNGREVPSGFHNTNYESQSMQAHDMYLGPVSHAGSMGHNGRIPPSVRLALGMNDARRRQKVKYNFCVFCKNNGEDEKVYMGHTLKHDNGTIRCPILYNYECPLCGATGPVSHTIRYCPSSKGKQQVEEMASITQLKQMRSSTGRLRTNHNNSPMPMQIMEGNPSYQSSSSVAAARQFYNPQQQVAACNALAQGQSATYARPVLGQGTRGRDMSFSGANAGWTATSNPPLIPPMYGEYVNTQNRRYNYESYCLQAAHQFSQGQAATQPQMQIPSQVNYSQAQ